VRNQKEGSAGTCDRRRAESPRPPGHRLVMENDDATASACLSARRGVAQGRIRTLWVGVSV